MRDERIGDRLVFHAGNGEWYNQPHNKRWDMGEDAAELPPANWHVELESVLAAQDPRPSTVVVDVTAMDWLVGQDWGFLLRLSKQLVVQGSRLAVVGTRRIVRGGAVLGLDGFFGLSDSIEDVREST